MLVWDDTRQRYIPTLLTGSLLTGFTDQYIPFGNATGGLNQNASLRWNGLTLNVISRVAVGEGTASDTDGRFLVDWNATSNDAHLNAYQGAAFRPLFLDGSDLKLQTDSGGTLSVGTTATVATFNGTTASVSTGTGAVVIAGGLGVAGQVSAATLLASGLTSGRVPYVSTGGLLIDSASLLYNGTTFGVVSRIAAGEASCSDTDGRLILEWNPGTNAAAINSYQAAYRPLELDASALSIQTNSGGTISVGTTATVTTHNGTTASTSPTTGALIVAGGVGVTGDFCIAGGLRFTGTSTSDGFYKTNNTSAVLLGGGNGTGVGAVVQMFGGAHATLPNEGYFQSNGANIATWNTTQLKVLQTTASTTTASGALVVAGGLGVAGQITFDGNTGVSLRVTNAVANAAVATVLTAVGPTGANTTVQGWLRLSVAGTDRFIPFW